MSAETTLQAADACSKRVFEHLEVTAPWVIASMDAPTRQVFLAGMGLAFSEGTVYGAQKVVNRFAAA
jgi:hypothetical protein